MDALAKVFSVKSEKNLTLLKEQIQRQRKCWHTRNSWAFMSAPCITTGTRLDIGFDELFYSFNFQPIPIIDKEVMETKWDITEKLKKINTPALILYGRQDDQGESVFYLQKECLRNSAMQVIRTMRAYDLGRPARTIL